MSAAGQEESIIFRGVDPEEAENFIRSVKVQAFRAGKSDDQNWVATLASTAFAGKALRWYLRLPVQTRQDWDQLQEAIIENEWGRDNTSTLNSTTVAPAPAAAPPPTLSRVPAAISPQPASGSAPSHPPKSRSRAARTASVRVIADDPSCNGYLTVDESRGRCYSNPTPKEVFSVSWKPPFPCALQIQYNSPPKAWLGAQHLNPEHTDATGQLGPGSAEYLALTPITDLSESPFRALAHAKDYKYSGRFYVSMWNVLEDLSLVPTVKQSGCTFELAPLVLNSKFKEVILASDSPTIQREYARLNNHVSLEPAVGPLLIGGRN
ncbi:hypothetical protein FS837_002641 [Tulasnella sp. UAMH 9824]|nr:hypothetical protein FS837_002641 [Tulasnella sp. UAMH 9824]